jgi:hypothetical protein
MGKKHTEGAHGLASPIAVKCFVLYSERVAKVKCDEDDQKKSSTPRAQLQVRTRQAIQSAHTTHVDEANAWPLCPRHCAAFASRSATRRSGC